MDIKEKSTSKDKLLKICVTAMFAALICVATMLIQIPSPLNGYVNFGDCFILIAAWVLGPVYGFAAGGIGSALADLFTGYVHYVPGTFVIKGLIAVAAALICRAMLKKMPKISVPAYIVSALAGEIIMVGGDVQKAVSLALGADLRDFTGSAEIGLDSGFYPADSSDVILRLNEQKQDTAAGVYSELAVEFFDNSGDDEELIYSLKCGAYVPGGGAVG